MRRHVLGWIVGAACVGAVAVAVLATRHSSRADGSPIDPRGGWHVAWIASCLAALALSGFAVLLGKRGVLTLKTALAVAVVVQMLPLAAPLLLSRDVYIYWADARVLVVHGANPYRSPPGRFAGDPGTRAASPQWRTQTEAYGPVWAAAGSVPAAVAGTSGDAVQLGYRVLALAGVLLTIAVLSWRRQGAAAAVALVGWSPTVALHFTGGGHNDAFMVAVLTSALALGSRATAGVLWPVSALVKPLAAVVLPLELAREHTVAHGGSGSRSRARASHLPQPRSQCSVSAGSRGRRSLCMSRRRSAACTFSSKPGCNTAMQSLSRGWRSWSSTACSYALPGVADARTSASPRPHSACA